MAYNLTNFTNITSIYDVALNLQSLSTGYLGTGFVLTLTIVMFGVFKRFEKDTREVFVFTSFVMTFLCIIMTFINLLSWTITGIYIGFFMLSFLFWILTQD